jgi:hypothetical protein
MTCREMAEFSSNFKLEVGDHDSDFVLLWRVGRAFRALACTSSGCSRRKTTHLGMDGQDCVGGFARQCAELRPVFCATVVSLETCIDCNAKEGRGYQSIA